MAEGKRMQSLREKIQRGKLYPLGEALDLVKQCGSAKFKESVDVSIRLGIDPRKTDQNVRGATVMPNGTGKDVRVAVFAQGENAEKAKAAGADIVGFQDLADEIKGGKMDFDMVIATPDAMRIVGQLGQILGPRGLMPNPKLGTVTPNVEGAINNAKSGQVNYRTDKGGIIHGSIGKADFEADALEGNLKALLRDLIKAKPASAKGQYLQKISVSTTMGPGIIIDNTTLGLN